MNSDAGFPFTRRSQGFSRYTYSYDTSGEYLLGVTVPGALTTAYTYQSAPGTPADHALTSVTFPDGTHQFFGWDSRGRVAEQSRDGGAERLQFTYDATGTVAIRDAQDAVTTLRLGDRGQILQTTDALGQTATFRYDTNYNLTQLTGPAGETTGLTSVSSARRALAMPKREAQFAHGGFFLHRAWMMGPIGPKGIAPFYRPATSIDD